MKEIKQQAEALCELLKKAKTAFITTHQKPDGDAMGSSLGLMHFLKSRGIQATFVAPTPFPDFYNWMPGVEKTLVYSEETKAEVQKQIDNADLVFCLDFNTLKRCGEVAPLIEASGSTKILIDHHPQPDDFAQLTISHVSASSTGEILFELIDQLSEGGLKSYDISASLYAAILTDTGMFQFNSTSARVHEIVAQLLRNGVKSGEIYDLVYNSFDKDRLLLFGHCISQMQIVGEGALMTVSRKEMKRFNIGLGGTEGLVNYPLKISGIKLAALFREDTDHVRMSFRSKGDVDVNQLAREHFNGGGHKNAAGGRLEGSLADAIDKFVSILARRKESSSV